MSVGVFFFGGTNDLWNLFFAVGGRSVGLVPVSIAGLECNV